MWLLTEAHEKPLLVWIACSDGAERTSALQQKCSVRMLSGMFRNSPEVKPAEISDRHGCAWGFGNHIFNHIPTGKECF